MKPTPLRASADLAITTAAAPNPAQWYFTGQHVASHKLVASPARTFPDFIQQFVCLPVPLSITCAEYHALEDAEKKKFKLVRYFVACTFPSSQWEGRKLEHAQACVLLILDIDSHEDAKRFVENPGLLVELLRKFNFAAFQTISSTPENPRLRIMVEASEISVEKYPDAVLTIASLLGLSEVTPESLRATQPMFPMVAFSDQDDFWNAAPVPVTHYDGRAFAVEDISTDSADFPPLSSGNKPVTTPRSTGNALDDYLLNYEPPDPRHTIKIVEGMLKCIDADCSRDDWLEIAAALQHQFGSTDPDEAYALFDKWSATGIKYEDEKDTATVWKSFSEPPKDRPLVKIGTIIKRAKDGVWIRPASSHTTDGTGPLDFSTAVTIFDLLETPPDPQDTLLGNRLLCRGGTLLFVGPSGIGKSSSSMQQDICWALGREAFGITPARPLRILTIQAENDRGDLHEMASGVVHGVANDLTEEERKLLKNNLRYLTVTAALGDNFLVLLDRVLTARPCDLVRVDPLFAFYGFKIEDTEQLSRFLRAGLNPILQKHSCALILCHHTPKITNRDSSAWSATDYSYAGAGGAELTNWARAILVIDATAIPGTYKWIAAKRGSRIGWRDGLDKKEFIRFYQHSRREDVICWEDANPDDVAAADNIKRAKQRACSVDPVLLIEAIVPPSAPIEKNALIAEVNSKGAGITSIRTALTRLLSADEPQFFEHREKRPKTNERRLIARFPQAA